MGSKTIIFVTMSMHVTQRHFIAFWCNFLILAFVSVRSLCLVEEVYDLWSDKRPIYRESTLLEPRFGARYVCVVLRVWFFI